jgi:hypothetical protein
VLFTLFYELFPAGDHFPPPAYLHRLVKSLVLALVLFFRYHLQQLQPPQEHLDLYP